MTDLSNELATQIYLLREKKENIAMDDLSLILEKVAKVINEKDSPIEKFLRDEIVKIASHIEKTKNEIIALSPEIAQGKDTTTATIQLEAVLQSTEEAAVSIMDAVDEIQQVIEQSSANAETKTRISAISARIYEACNFQDLTGQRIRKVMHALEFTEHKINKLVAMFSSEGMVIPESVLKDEHPEAGLLNGPQLSKDAPSQSDIDALFG